MNPSDCNRAIFSLESGFPLLQTWTVLSAPFASTLSSRTLIIWSLFSVGCHCGLFPFESVCPAFREAVPRVYRPENGFSFSTSVPLLEAFKARFNLVTEFRASVPVSSKFVSPRCFLPRVPLSSQCGGTDINQSPPFSVPPFPEDVLVHRPSTLSSPALGGIVSASQRLSFSKGRCR